MDSFPDPGSPVINTGLLLEASLLDKPARDSTLGCHQRCLHNQIQGEFPLALASSLPSTEISRTHARRVFVPHRVPKEISSSRTENNRSDDAAVRETTSLLDGESIVPSYKRLDVGEDNLYKGLALRGDTYPNALLQRLPLDKWRLGCRFGTHPGITMLSQMPKAFNSSRIAGLPEGGNGSGTVSASQPSQRCGGVRFCAARGFRRFYLHCADFRRHMRRLRTH
jgi:hypothetical protein